MSCFFNKDREDGLRSHVFPNDSIFRSAFTYNTEREFSNNYAISKQSANSSRTFQLIKLRISMKNETRSETRSKR